MSFLSRINVSGSDDHTVFGGEFTGGYMMQQEPACFDKLLTFLDKEKPFGKYLAIGIAAGGAERLICETMGIKSLTVIDDGLHPNHPKWAKNKAELIAQGIEVKEHIGNSMDYKAEEFLDNSRDTFDLVSIDGDHSYEGVANDFRIALKHCKAGALVWFHDVNATVVSGPRSFFNEISDKYTVKLHTPGRCGIGVVRVGA